MREGCGIPVGVRCSTTSLGSRVFILLWWIQISMTRSGHGSASQWSFPHPHTGILGSFPDSEAVFKSGVKAELCLVPAIPS